MKAFNKSTLAMFKRAIKYMLPYKLRFILAFFCITSGVLFDIIQPLLWAKIITSIINRNHSGLIHLILLQSFFFILKTSIGFLQSYLFSYLNENLIFDFKKDMYRRIFDLPMKAFDDIKVGEFISRLHGDASVVSNVLTNQLLNTIVDIVKVVVIGVVVFKLNLKLGIIILLMFPISLLIFSFSGTTLKIKTKELACLNDSYFSDMQQTILGMREVKSLGIIGARLKTYLGLASSIKTKNIQLNIIRTLTLTLSHSITMITDLIVIAFGGYMVLSNSLSFEHFIAFGSYSTQFSGSLMNITRLNTNIYQMATALERIFGLMDNLEYSQQEFGNKIIEDIKGDIRFSKVSFGYNENSYVLNDITLKIMNNRKNAIIGLSGSGKTTIFNLLLRFYDPREGEVFIDDTNIKDLREDYLRNIVSIVRQEPFLFNMTIKDNLIISNPSVSDDEVNEACKIAHIDKFIQSLPDGYSTIVGENGVKISSGQKQRIAIARAILKKSKIVLFDEATSALDNESQANIRNSIDELSKNHTVVIIAHRLSTIMGADNIIVVDNGRIDGQGGHEELLAINNIYKRLFECEIDNLNSK